MDIRTAIQKLSKSDLFESILGTVKEVDPDKKTCTVQPLDDQPEILEVRLSAVESPDKGVILIPTVESFVIVGQTANEQPHVIMFSEVDSVSTLFQDVEHKLDANGMKLTVGSNDFKEGLEDLKTAIGQLKVMTSQGQSSIPINIIDINSAFDKVLGTLH
jgi:hypothetical protein